MVREGIQIFDNLTDLYITPSNYLVKPFVGFINEKSKFTIDPCEVQKIIPVDFFSLNEIRIIKEKLITYTGGHKINPPYYDIEGFLIWGATAMIISELNAVVKKITSF